MNAERLLGSLVRGALGGGGRRRKRGRGAMRYLTGGRGGLVNAGTLLTAAGLAWGAFEAATARSGGGGAAPGGGAPSPPRPQPPPPPVPGAPPPPLPGAAPAVPEGVLRLVRLMVSAAMADGRLDPEEEKRMLEQAREAGAEELVRAELAHPRPLPEILRGAEDPALKADLYRLAFAIVRADEQVTGAERIYLAQLAHGLALTPADVQQLESEVAGRIDSAAGEEGEG